MSYAKMQLTKLSFKRYTDTELSARLAPGGDHHADVVEGGIWWLHTQCNIAEHAGDTKRLKKLEAAIKKCNDRYYARLARASKNIT
jgi:hypothetical protein